MNFRILMQKWLAPIALLAANAACGASWEFAGSPPSLMPAPAAVREAPSPPVGKWQAKADDAVRLDVIAQKPLPDLRAQPVALAPLQQFPDAVRQVFEREWSLAALRRGAGAFLDPRVLQRIDVRKERAETKGTVKETTQWSGAIDQMAPLAKVSAAGLLIQLDLRGVEQVERKVEWLYLLGADEIAAYAEQLKAYRDAQADYAKALRAKGHAYMEQFERAKLNFEAEGGRFDESAAGQRAIASAEAYRQWSSQYRQLMALTTAGAGLPKATEPALRAAAERERGAQKAILAAQLAMDAKLLQVETGELLWAGQLTVTGQDLSAAAAVALQQLLDALVPAARSAPTPAAPPAPAGTPQGLN